MVSATMLAVSACASVDEYTRSDAPRSVADAALLASLPDDWAARQLLGSETGNWLDSFNDDQLNALVAEALIENFDLAQAVERLRQAEALAVSARSGLLPTLDGSFGFSRRESVFESDQQIFIDPQGNQITQNGELITNTVESFDLGVSASWEADVWGRLRDAARAGKLDVVAAEADVAAFRLLLAGQVAQAWFDLIEAEQLVRLSSDEIDSQNRSLELTQRRYDAGVVGALDVRLARSALAAAEATAARRSALLATAKRRLEVLLGRYPAAELASTERLPVLPALAGAVAPGDVLARRPDLQAAEARLAAAGLRADQARKALLPRLSLRADLGTSDNEIANVFDPDFLSNTLVANIAQPLFRGGALRAEKRRQESLARTQLLQYAETALTAFSEAENALQNDLAFALEETSRVTAVEEAEAAERLAERNYREGVGTIFNLLDAQRRRINAEAALISTRKERASNRVRLHVAIAGPFDTGPVSQL